jgi:hypothetical protein
VYGFLAPVLVSDVFMHMDGISIWIPTMRKKKKKKEEEEEGAS